MKERRAAIEHLIKSHNIADQITLVTLLEKEFGITTTQSIVSRDLHALGVIKHKTEQGLCYTLPATSLEEDLMQKGICNILHNQSVIVIKTQSAAAPLITEIIDSWELEEIIGTLAGENTIIVVPRDIRNIAETFHMLCKKMGWKKMELRKKHDY